MYISIAVNKVPTKGSTDFFKALPELMKEAKTWKLVSHGAKEATLESTATMTSVPKPPSFKLTENAAGSVSAVLLDKGWSKEEEALALGPLVYLCLTALSSFVKDVHIGG